MDNTRRLQSVPSTRSTFPTSQPPLLRTACCVPSTVYSVLPDRACHPPDPCPPTPINNLAARFHFPAPSLAPPPAQPRLQILCFAPCRTAYCVDSSCSQPFRHRDHRPRQLPSPTLSRAPCCPLYSYRSYCQQPRFQSLVRNTPPRSGGLTTLVRSAIDPPASLLSVGRAHRAVNTSVCCSRLTETLWVAWSPVACSTQRIRHTACTAVICGTSDRLVTKSPWLSTGSTTRAYKRHLLLLRTKLVDGASQSSRVYVH